MKNLSLPKWHPDIEPCVPLGGARTYFCFIFDLSLDPRPEVAARLAGYVAGYPALARQGNAMFAQCGSVLFDRAMRDDPVAHLYLDLGGGG